ncbi:MAG TPA: hypothetical protein VME86_04080 [Acidobacteriaceae bacterium]|nr:hypothetical protein [Acidobacteriaceae bacterium]
MTPVGSVQSGNAGAQQASAAKQNDVTAIDILLDPDATMIQHATAANARLLQNFPKGYTLGGAHAPHISVLQRYVKTANLDQVYAAADKVFATENPPSWKLTAFKYYYIPAKPVGLGGIVIKPTPDLLRLQQKLIDAVKPFTAPTGTAAAFVTTAQDPDIIPQAIQYIGAFVPDHSGDHYAPHVTIGIGLIDFLDKMVAAPFDNFTFSPVGASVYHLGNYGTAMKKLHAVKLK